MQTNTSLLYHPYKALDMVQEMGFIPVRLFKVLYPLWRVRVDGRQRLTGDFDEMEWYLERGIGEAGLASVAELASFFGLEMDFVRRLVDLSRGIGHIRGEEGSLELTALGLASVKEKARYEERKTTTELYFDALGNKPLSAEHYKVPILEALPEKTPFQAFYQFDKTWQPAAISQLKNSLPAEIRAELLNREPAYLPAYFVEARGKEPSSPLHLLVFSQVRGLHDSVLQEAVNRDPVVYRALKAKTDSRAEAVRRYFEQSGLKKDAWYLNENGQWGAQVMVDGQVFLPGADEDESVRLSVRSVGRYALIYDWCIWVLCDDPSIRNQAAAEQIIDWLQAANARPSREEIQRKINGLSQRLSVQPPAVSVLLSLARRKGQLRAAERLEELDE